MSIQGSHLSANFLRVHSSKSLRKCQLLEGTFIYSHTHKKWENLHEENRVIVSDKLST